jgi:hypothetical protein
MENRLPAFQPIYNFVMRARLAECDLKSHSASSAPHRRHQPGWRPATTGSPSDTSRDGFQPSLAVPAP